MSTFEKNVFVNCPFDEDYRQILIALLFTIRSMGYVPRLALEESDCGTIRIQKITRLIEESRIGIHDLSRMEARKKGECSRMNMPFELGIDYAAKILSHSVENWARKKLLILESQKYQYQKAISDLSGCDIKSHNNDPLEVIKAIRNWFLVEEKIPLPSYNKIWYAFNDFNAFLSEELLKSGHKLDEISGIPVPEVLAHIDTWQMRKALVAA